MSFVKGLKRAFGFSTDGDEIDDEVDYYDGTRRSPFALPAPQRELADDASATQSVQTALSAGNGSNNAQVSSSEAPDKTPAAASLPSNNATRALPDSISSTIINVINSNLPPIIKDCIDIDAEKQAIDAAIGKEFIDFVNGEKSKALSAGNLQRDIDKNALAEATEKLNAANALNKVMSAQTAELKQKVASISDEKEQQSIELKGLQNKIKVLQLRESQYKTTEQEAERLRALTEEQKDSLMQCENRNAQLEAQLREANEKLGETQANKADKAALEQLNAEIAKKCDEIALLQAEIGKRDCEMAKQSEQISELQANLDMAAEIQHKVEQAEENRRKSNEQISQLKKSLDTVEASYKAKIAVKEQEKNNLEADNEALRKEIEKMKAKADKDASVQKQRDIDTANNIDRLKSLLARNNEKATLLEAQVKDLEASLSQAAVQSKAVAQKADEEVQVLSDQLHKAQAEISDLRQQLTDSQRTLSSTQAALMSSESQLKETIDALNDANDRIAAMSSESATPYEHTEPAVTTPPLETSDDDIAATTVRGNDIDLNEIDWLTPVPFNEPEPEPEPEPVVEKPKPQIDDGRQLSLF